MLTKYFFSKFHSRFSYILNLWYWWRRGKLFRDKQLCLLIKTEEEKMKESSQIVWLGQYLWVTYIYVVWAYKFDILKDYSCYVKCKCFVSLWVRFKRFLLSNFVICKKMLYILTSVSTDWMMFQQLLYGLEHLSFLLLWIFYSSLSYAFSLIHPVT